MKSCLPRALITLIAGIFFLLIGSYFSTRSFLKGEEFTSLMEYKLSEKLEGEVQLSGAQWDGWILNNESVTAPAGKGFSELELERVSIEVDPKGFLKRIWKISEIHIRDASVHLGTPHKKEGEPFQLGDMPVEFSWKDLGKAWLPKKAHVERIQVENSQGTFLNAETSGQWKSLEVLLEKAGNDYTFSTPRGRASISQMPDVEWQVMRGDGRLRPSDYFITEAKLEGPDTSILEFTGEGDYTGKATLQGSLQDLPVTTLLEETWKRKFLGEVEAEFIYKTGSHASTLTGIGSVQNATLTALPALDTIARQTGISRFRRIPFQTCTFSFKRENGVTTLKELNLESPDFLKITGEVESDGTVGKGTLQLGIHSSVREKMPAGIETLFPHSRENYFWAPVTLTQQEGEWKDDLSPKAMSALLKGFLSGGTDTAATLLKGLKEALPNTEDADGENSGEDLLKEGSEVIEKGVKSLFDLLGK